MLPQMEGEDYNATLETLRTDVGGDRPGVDFVTVLDVSWKNLKILKSALKLLIGKLNSIDRLSIVILSSKPRKLCSLRQITESSLDDFETLVNNLTFGPDRDITAGIQMGLEVINSRRFTTGRLAAVMLMSDGILNNYDPSTAQVQLGNIPVYAFALGKRYDPKVLKEFSIQSTGITFYSIRHTFESRYAFFLCFLRLFYQPVSDLGLTMKQKKSTIRSLFAIKYPQFLDPGDGSPTLKEMKSTIQTLLADKYTQIKDLGDVSVTKKQRKLALQTSLADKYPPFIVSDDRSVNVKDMKSTICDVFPGKYTDDAS